MTKYSGRVIVYEGITKDFGVLVDTEINLFIKWLMSKNKFDKDIAWAEFKRAEHNRELYAVKIADYIARYEEEDRLGV